MRLFIAIQFEDHRREKAEKRGGFDQRILLESVEE